MDQEELLEVLLEIADFLEIGKIHEARIRLLAVISELTCPPTAD